MLLKNRTQNLFRYFNKKVYYVFVWKQSVYKNIKDLFLNAKHKQLQIFRRDLERYCYVLLDIDIWILSE